MTKGLKTKKEVILGITGSIAAYMSCSVASQLRKKGVTVTAVMTKDALEFITALSLQIISNNKVYTELFEAPEKYNPVHTSLAERADLILIAPATANIIAKIANGICDDILTCTVCSTDAPILIAPAMNDRMYKNKITQMNIEKLKSAGYKFVGPIEGDLACGYKALGHIATVDNIVRKALDILNA